MYICVLLFYVYKFVFCHKAGLYSKCEKNRKQVSLWLIQIDRAHAELLAAKDVKELSHAGLCSACDWTACCALNTLLHVFAHKRVAVSCEGNEKDQVNNCIALWRLGARVPEEKYCSHGWQSPQPSHEPPHTAPTPITLNKSVENKEGWLHWISQWRNKGEGGVVKKNTANANRRRHATQNAMLTICHVKPTLYGDQRPLTT